MIGSAVGGAFGYGYTVLQQHYAQYCVKCEISALPIVTGAAIGAAVALFSKK